MFLRKGLALINMLIFVIIFTILSASVLSMVGIHSRVMEDHIRRVKTYYADEAALVFAIDRAKNTGTIPSNLSIEWELGTPPLFKNVTLTSAFGAGPLGTWRINASHDYRW